jgi:DMSO/TMAO reductase YedYZ molybdopterin-dependent catalytic subunit
MKPAGIAMTRREFVRIAGSAIVAARLPMVLRVATAERPAPPFGGLTPANRFYVTTYGSTPHIDRAAWRLRIGGLVEHPIELRWEDIRKLPTIDETLTLECISNPPDGNLIGNARWAGPALRPLLERVRIKHNAVYAALYAADGYFTGIPIDEFTRRENFMPYLINGAPLPLAHGFPLRLFIPGKYGMKQPKWITRIKFVDRKFVGYWEMRGWSNSAWRKVNSGFFSPRPIPMVSADLAVPTRVAAPVDIWGWALAGPSGIRKVEVSTDGGIEWREAELVENRKRYQWTVWRYHFAPHAPGTYHLRVRATASNGRTQPVVDPQQGSGISGQPRMDLEINGS